MIDWLALIIVLATTVVGALASVGLVALGIRLLATPDRPGQVGEATDEEEDDVNVSGRRPLVATIGGIACFVVFAAIVVFGIWLIIPYF